MSETMQIRDWLAARQLANDPPAIAQDREVRRKTFHSDDGIASHPPPLDERHKGILQTLLQRPSWRLAELRAVTSRAGLMPLACVARINEWAIDAYGDLLLEGEDLIALNTSLIKRLQL